MSHIRSKLTARLSGVLSSWIPAIAIGFIIGFASPAVAEPRANLLLDVTLNDVKKRIVGNFVRDASGQIGAKASELDEVGVKPSEKVSDPEAIILLNSIPGVTYRYDETNQAISINAPIGALATQKLSGSPEVDVDGAEAVAPQRNWGALANYSLYAAGARDLKTKRTDFSGYSVNLEARAFTPFGTLTQTQILVGTEASTRNLKATRLDTTFTYSDSDTQITYRGGDAITGGLVWTRPVRIGGLQAQRNFGLRSDLITLPLPTLSGSAAVPSSVDVYVNNLKTYSQDVSTGPFQINNLPSISGAGTARVVVRDATGKEIEQSTPFFVSAKMLKPGLYDFSAEAGFARLNFAQENFSYNRKPMASLSGRYGVTDWLTMDSHAEAMPGFGLGGLGANVNTFGFGVLSLAGSASWFRQEGFGSQVYGAYDFSFKDITVGVSAQRTFHSYNDLASVTAPKLTASNSLKTASQVAGFGGVFDFGSIRPPRAIDKLTVGVPLSFDSSALNFSLARVVDGAGKQSKIASTSYSRKLPFAGSLFATAYFDLSNKKNAGVFAGVSFPFGDDISTAASVSRSKSGMQFGAQASKSIRSEEGSYGWRVSDTEGANPQRAAAVAYRSGFAQIEAGANQVGHGVQGAVQVEGSIAAAGGGVFFAPRINDAFAIVDAGAPNIPVEYENRRVTTTGSNGKAIVPDLRSFQKNKLAIDPTNLPLNASVQSTRETVVPADGGGVYVQFGVQETVSSAIIKLVNAEGKPLKTGLSGRLNDGEDFVVGYDGRAFIKGLAADNTVAIDTEPGACKASFNYQANGDTQVVIGPLQCR